MEALKWFIYKLLLKVINSGNNTPNMTYPEDFATSGDSQFHWIFCTTIGELNACKPFIKDISLNQQLVIITDRDCYQQAYHQHFPQAIIVELTGSADEADYLTKKLPPSFLTVCEVPALPNDAPCRLGYPFLRKVKKQGAKLFLVNGWLYQYKPTCRQDKIERKLFTSEYVNLFDTITVQTESVRDQLILKGAKRENIHVTGNMKFDALSTNFTYKDDISKRIIEELNHSNNKVLVAGCVSSEWEYKLLVNGFLHLKKHSEAKLVLAPRHPEKQLELEKIKQILKEFELTFEFKSNVVESLDKDTQVLILDTFGELRSYYAAADISYIGRNHNILEPLVFGKPVIIFTGWEKSYPSYPVYQITKEQELVTEVSSEVELNQAIISSEQANQQLLTEKINNSLTSLSGVTEKNIALIFGTKNGQ